MDKETNNIEEKDLTPENWHLIEEADYNEILQFVQEKAFKKIHRAKIDENMVQIDSIWVRKWKRYPDGSLKVKSRMCARGCFDRTAHLEARCLVNEEHEPGVFPLEQVHLHVLVEVAGPSSSRLWSIGKSHVLPTDSTLPYGLDCKLDDLLIHVGFLQEIAEVADGAVPEALMQTEQ